MKRHIQFAAVMVMAAVSTVSALAQNASAQTSRVYRDSNGWTEEITGTLSGSKQLRVTTDIGSVQVAGSGNNQIRYVIHKRSNSGSEESARRSFEDFRITTKQGGGTAYIEGSSEGGRSRRLNADFQIEVPREMTLVKVNSDGGTLNIRSITGRVEGETGGGSIKLDDLGGYASAETGGGSIDVGTTAGDLNLHTGGGSVKVVSAKGRVAVETGGGAISIGQASSVSAETGGGSIDVQKCPGDLKAQTGGGSIDISDVAGPVTMETGGGSIRLSGAKGPVKAETGGGSIELLKLTQGAKAETGAGSIKAEFIANNTSSSSSLETSVGDIIIYISPDVKMTVHATISTAFGHKIRSDFPDLKITSEGGDYGPKTMYAEGNLNGGGPVLKVRTSMGNIEFRRR